VTATISTETAPPAGANGASGGAGIAHADGAHVTDGTVGADGTAALSELQERVFLDRYARRDDTGRTLERTPTQMWRRVAAAIAAVEPTAALRREWEARFYDSLAGFKFVPGGRIMSGAGTGAHVSFYNCYVVPSPEDSRGGIIDNLKVLVEIMARGGGVGVNLSTLRPRGSHIKTVNGTSSGPCAWAELYSVATGDVIQQGGTRRGALMVMLNDDHPDIEEFVTVKRDLRRLTHANLSVCVSDAFMEAVKQDAEWHLTWDGEVRKSLPARRLWNLICESAWASGEPGLVFIDRYNKESNTWYYERIQTVNPCIAAGELVFTDRGLLPFEDVRVGMRVMTHRGRFRRVVRAQCTRRDAEIVRVVLSNGLTLHCTPDHRLIDKDGLKVQAWQAVAARIRTMSCDAGLRATGVPAWGTVERVDRAGRSDVYDLTVEEDHTFVVSGVCVANCGEQGLPDWGVCNLGALNLAAFVRGGDTATPGTIDHEALAAHARVAVRFLDNVVDATEYFYPENAEAQLSTRRTGLGTMGLADALIKLHVPYGSDESLRVIEQIYATIRDAAYECSTDLAAEKGPFPKFDKEKYLQGRFIGRLPEAPREKIAAQGIRNAVLLTQAPTGTTSLLAGVSSGIEPVYDFAMVRRDRLGEHVLYHPLLQQWREAHPDREVSEKPGWFVAANDLTPEEHVRVQAMVQRYTDSSISKTVNAPNDHTQEAVQELYVKAYDYGCKGVTYFRDGCREGVLSHGGPGAPDALRTEAVQPRLPGLPMADAPDGAAGTHLAPRPRAAEGITYRMPTPLGTMFTTVTRRADGEPFEAFLQVGKAGSDTAAVTEALGRLISLILRLPSPLSPGDRLRDVVDQLAGIGGGRQLGFGPKRVRSLPDAVAQVLAEFLGRAPALDTADAPDTISGAAHAAGDLCPGCGDATLVYQEGCRTCRACGHSEC
jgi:ribonucleotide reductase alpha subunit